VISLRRGKGLHGKIQAVDLQGHTDAAIGQTRVKTNNLSSAIHETGLTGESKFLRQYQDTLKFLPDRETGYLGAKVNALGADIPRFCIKLRLGSRDLDSDQHFQIQAGHFSPFLLAIRHMGDSRFLSGQLRMRCADPVMTLKSTGTANHPIEIKHLIQRDLSIFGQKLPAMLAPFEGILPLTNIDLRLEQ
jgi:hypothetical protein